MKTCAMCGIELSAGYRRSYNPATNFQWLCQSCYEKRRRMVEVLNEQRQRARGVRLPDDLTLDQWLATLQDFNGKCAYCLINPGTILEHFVPVKYGGRGTTKSNCVPACKTCNLKKRNRFPNQVTTIPKEDMERIYQYLLQFRDEILDIVL